MKITLNGQELSLDEAIKIALEDKRGLGCIFHDKNDADLNFLIRLGNETSIQIEDNFKLDAYKSFFASLQSRAVVIFDGEKAL